MCCSALRFWYQQLRPNIHPSLLSAGPACLPALLRDLRHAHSAMGSKQQARLARSTCWRCYGECNLKGALQLYAAPCCYCWLLQSQSCDWLGRFIACRRHAAWTSLAAPISFSLLLPPAASAHELASLPSSGGGPPGGSGSGSSGGGGGGGWHSGGGGNSSEALVRRRPQELFEIAAKQPPIMLMLASFAVTRKAYSKVSVGKLAHRPADAGHDPLPVSASGTAFPLFLACILKGAFCGEHCTAPPRNFSSSCSIQVSHDHLLFCHPPSPHPLDSPCPTAPVIHLTAWQSPLPHPAPPQSSIPPRS